jgi:hypothetical protein
MLLVHKVIQASSRHVFCKVIKKKVKRVLQEENAKTYNICYEARLKKYFQQVTSNPRRLKL